MSTGSKSPPPLLWPLGVKAQDSSLGYLSHINLETAWSLHFGAIFNHSIVKSQTSRAYEKQAFSSASFDTSSRNVDIHQS
jgi:hypothetical protein